MDIMCVLLLLYHHIGIVITQCNFFIENIITAQLFDVHVVVEMSDFSCQSLTPIGASVVAPQE